MGPNILGNPYHISVTRVGMTKNLDARFDEVRDEIICTFEDHLKLEGNGEYRVTEGRSSFYCWPQNGRRSLLKQQLCKPSAELAIDSSLDYPYVRRRPFPRTTALIHLLILGRNTDYLNLNFEFTISVVMAAQMINILPGFLRP
jgi:hypothetical protein